MQMGIDIKGIVLTIVLMEKGHIHGQAGKNTKGIGLMIIDMVIALIHGRT
jgi:hypothetical protein